MPPTILLPSRGLPKGGRYFLSNPTGDDDLGVIQDAIDAVHSDGGGIVEFAQGTYRTSGPVQTYSDVAVNGTGWTSSFIKPLDDAVFTAQQAVIMSDGFTQDADLWNYYPPYPSGIHMGVGLANICIDGNRANVANANGLMVYGGKFRFNNLAVINTDGHGIWTECGTTGSSTIGDDLHDFLNMHESVVGVVYIANTNKRGWWWRGPNDSYLQLAQIKNTGWASFLQESDGVTVDSPTLKIGKLHAYISNQAGDDPDEFMIKLTEGAEADFIYIDTPSKNGLILDGSKCQVGRVRVFKPSQTANDASFYAVDIGGSNNTIQSLKSLATARTTGAFGGILKISGTDCACLDLDIVENASSTIDTTPVLLTGNGGKAVGRVTGAVASTYAAKIEASRCMFDVEIKDSGTAGFRNENALTSRNRIRSVISGTGTGSYSQARNLQTTDVAEIVTTARARTTAQTLDFGNTGTATFNSGTMTLPSSNCSYSSGSLATVTDLSITIGQAPFVIVQNTGTANIVFTHDATKIKCSGGVDFTLLPGEAVMFVLNGAVAQMVR